MNEAQLETLFRKRVPLVLGGIVWKLAPTTAGIPDRLVMLPGGRMFLVELKTETGRLSPIQREIHHRLAELGIHVYTLRGRAQVLLWVEGCLDGATPTPLRS